MSILNTFLNPNTDKENIKLGDRYAEVAISIIQTKYENLSKDLEYITKYLCDIIIDRTGNSIDTLRELVKIDSIFCDPILRNMIHSTGYYVYQIYWFIIYVADDTEVFTKILNNKLESLLDDNDKLSSFITYIASRCLISNNYKYLNILCNGMIRYKVKKASFTNIRPETFETPISDILSLYRNIYRDDICMLIYYYSVNHIEKYSEEVNEIDKLIISLVDDEYNIIVATLKLLMGTNSKNKPQTYNKGYICINIMLDHLIKIGTKIDDNNNNILRKINIIFRRANDSDRMQNAKNLLDKYLSVLYAPINRPSIIFQFYNTLERYEDRLDIVKNIIDNTEEEVCEIVYRLSIEIGNNDIYILILNKYPHFIDMLII